LMTRCNKGWIDWPISEGFIDTPSRDKGSNECANLIESLREIYH
jgi:hypothetical protein